MTLQLGDPLGRFGSGERRLVEVISDDFNRPDGDLGDGDDWTVIYSGQRFIIDDGKVRRNGTTTTNGTVNAALYSDPLSGLNQWVEVEVDGFSEGSVVLRCEGLVAGSSAVIIRIAQAGVAVAVDTVRVANSNISSIVSGSHASVSAATIRAEIDESNTVLVYYDNLLVFGCTVPDAPTGTYVGFNPSGNAAAPTADNFRAGTF